MYISFVMNIRTSKIPNSIVHGSLHTVVTRQSLLGFHRENNTKNKYLDPSCTKTVLLLFIREQDAKGISTVIESCQKKVVKFNRELDVVNDQTSFVHKAFNFELTKKDQADSIKPIHTETIPYDYAEKLCLLHYFDMMVVYNMNILMIDNVNYEIDLECYEYKTYEFPNRSVQEKIFRDMLY